MRRGLRRRLRAVLATGLALGSTAGLTIACGSTAARSRSAPVAAMGAARWVAAWIASPQPAPPGSPFAAGFRGQTIRQIIYTSAGGSLARVRLDNTFGSGALVVGRASIGVAGAGGAVGPRIALSFAGQPSTTIPPGSQRFSDPVRLAVRPFERLAVSVFLPQATGAPTEHFNAHQFNYVTAGDHVLAHAARAFAGRVESWYFLSGVDVWSGQERRAVVALGDSITNGNGSSTGANARWPNDLARRLAALRGPTLSVVDAGIEGNRVLNAAPCCGESALDRFGRDVLGQPGVAEVIVLEGINDIGFSSSTDPATAPDTNVSAQQIIAGYEQLIGRAHAAGLKILGATLTPFGGSQHWTPAGEAKRQAIDAWIRTRGAFDGVIDFAHAVAEPGHPQHLNPRYDDGDHLHLNDAGYRAMAAAVNLAMLVQGA